MGWTLTAIATRAGKAVGLRRRWTGPYAVAHAAGRAQRGPRPGADNLASRVYAHRLTKANTADRKALEAAHSQLAADAGVVERAVASGAPVAAVAALASMWQQLSPPDQAAVRNPVGRDSAGPVVWGTVPAKQMDGTTCGAAAVSMMIAMGDPFVALWVMTGRLCAGYAPREVMAASWHGPVKRTVEQRWHALQRAVHVTVTERALLGLPWPRSLGTPPWGARGAARFHGLRFRGAMVNDRDGSDMRVLIAHASAALRDGIPVLLYSSGDSKAGLQAVVPRHVVLLTRRIEGGFHVFEPGTGALHVLRDRQMSEATKPLAALGNWKRISWMVLPSPRVR
ncbi:MAG: hypothetical protein CVT64_07675 [Actinobacteria bacterium HGW-Actinobacteria-4]|nr:MAG: hypothetical protein CVT64_07675 [Actinobacteria bacterium HGW-Actinobacteria-4]